MNTNKYQVWEGEMEAAGLDENGISFLSTIFSAMLGVMLFIALLGKTMLQPAFKGKPSAKKKLASTFRQTELNMSVS